MKKGLFVGITGLDLVYYMDQVPEINRKGKTNDYRYCIGGPAANAAITYTLLGGSAKLVTIIGDSPLGKLIKDELSQFDIEIIDMADGENVLPSISGIAVSSNGDRTVWSGQSFNHRLEECGDILKDVAFILTDCNIPSISDPLIEHGLPLVLDAGSWKPHMKEYIEASSETIASVHCVDPDRDLSDYKNYCDLAITNGENAIKWFSQDASGTIKPPSVEAVDTLGAGDVFHGAYCYYRYVENQSFDQALKSASLVAASSVTQVGIEAGIKKYVNMSR